MSLPNFFVVGAGRSGTTSLHHYLGQHPDVFLPAVKSPSHFYCIDHPESSSLQRKLVTRDYFVRDRKSYESLFSRTLGAAAVGDVSPAYLASRLVPRRIHESVPDARIICILRNPVDRFFARWVGQLRDGYEPQRDLDLLIVKELDAPIDLDDTAGTYLAAGFVSETLGRYIEVFGRSNVLILFFEDLVADAGTLIGDMFRFLGVDDSVRIDTSVRHNQSGGVIANPVLRRAWSATATPRAFVRPWVPAALRRGAFNVVGRSLQKPDFSPSARQRLVGAYDSEIRALESLTARSLDAWRQV